MKVINKQYTCHHQNTTKVKLKLQSSVLLISFWWTTFCTYTNHIHATIEIDANNNKDTSLTCQTKQINPFFDAKR